MIKNYFKIAWRNLVKSKVYSFINIGGLAVGMGVAMLIAFWMWDEVSYNKSFTNYRHIVRIKENSGSGADIRTFNSAPIPLSVYLRTVYASDFKKVAMASWNQPHIPATAEKKIAKQGMYVQPDFAHIFSFNMIKGSLNCLADPYSIVLSESLAKAMFGNNDPMNQTVKIDNKNSLKVSGVFKDFAHNSEFNDVAFFTTWEYYMVDQNWVKNGQANWDENSFQIYAQLRDNADLGQWAMGILSKTHKNKIIHL